MYEIVMWDETAHRWDPYLVGGPMANRFDTADEARAAAASLRQTGYADAKLAVRPWQQAERLGELNVEEV